MSRELADNYDHSTDDALEYILESVLMPDDGSPEFRQLKTDFNSQLVQHCSCSTGSCDQNKGCSHGGCYDYCSDGKELVLKQCLAGDNYPVFECNKLCNCAIDSCANRLVQYGPRCNLEIFHSQVFNSLGVRTCENVPRGAFICEYAGELLTVEEANRRLKTQDDQGLMNYVLCFNEFTKTEDRNQRPQVTIVDPSQRGNIGRYLNHSCQPNCEVVAVRIDCPIPRIGIFAKRDILAHEELCFHYGGEDQQDSTAETQACLCAADNCGGVMPNAKM